MLLIYRMTCEYSEIIYQVELSRSTVLQNSVQLKLPLMDIYLHAMVIINDNQSGE